MKHLKIGLCAALLPMLSGLATAAPLSKQINISHRGASAYAPEHTFFAYDLALMQDADMIECDLFLTKDEVPVCIHDETVNRTTGNSKTGRVDSFTLAELRGMDFGSWFNTQNPTQAKPEYVGAKVVPFEEQIDCYLRLNPMMRIHVETKDSAGGRAEAVMHELLTRKGLIATGKRGSPKGNVENSTIVLQSFDAGSLERMRMLNSTIPTGFLYAAPTQTVAQWQVAGTGPAYIDFFIPNSAVLLSDTTLISRFHAQGHAVHTWTVNDSNQMNTLLMLDVDGIFTNNPDLLRTAIDSRGTGFSKAQRGNPTNFAKGCPDIAGRVTSKDGPGDVWEATGERGVRLKTVVNVPASTPAPIPTSAPISTNNTAANAGRFGGGGLDAFGVLGLLALLVLRRF